MEKSDLIFSIVKEAGKIIENHFKGTFAIENKGLTDLVTTVDKEVDIFLRREIKKYFPDIGVLTEEGGEEQGFFNRKFVIDPLDGTTNFVKGYPNFCISVALLEDNQVTFGIVYNPINFDMYCAELGRGAFKNGVKIAVSKIRDLRSSLLATGFPYDFSFYSNFPQFEALFRKTLSVRVDGSAALDLARVGEGVIDGYWEKGLSIWDIAAGSLIVREAGGIVSDFSGSDQYLQKGEIIVGNLEIHKQILEVLNAF